MIGAFDTYYGRPEVSNSDLSELEKYFMPPEWVMDATAAYRFGNLIDAMITEEHRCDHYSLRVDDEQFTREEWDKAKRMLDAFRKDQLCQQFHQLSKGQNVMVREVELEYEGIPFTLPMRCKYDLWMGVLKYGADIKSTTATSQKQFEAAVKYFNYDRQRAVYMTISGAEKDMIIGISKVNQQIFKVPVTKTSELYISGMQKFQELAWRWHVLFGGLNIQMMKEVAA